MWAHPKLAEFDARNVKHASQQPLQCSHGLSARVEQVAAQLRLRLGKTLAWEGVVEAVGHAGEGSSAPNALDTREFVTILLGLAAECRLCALHRPPRVCERLLVVLRSGARLLEVVALHAALIVNYLNVSGLTAHDCRVGMGTKLTRARGGVHVKWCLPRIGPLGLGNEGRLLLVADHKVRLFRHKRLRGCYLRRGGPFCVSNGHRK